MLVVPYFKARMRDLRGNVKQANIRDCNYERDAGDVFQKKLCSERKRFQLSVEKTFILT